MNSFCIAIDNRKVPINIRSLYDTENCYDHHTNGIGHAELRVQLLQNPSLYGSLNKLASAARSDLEAFLKLSDGEIYERVYPKTPNSHCEPNWEVVNDLLQKKHMTLQLVYDEYCRMNAGQKTYSYSSFCRRYADKKPNWEPQDLFTNLHYVTGDVMEIDFAGDCQENDKLTYLNERQIDLPVDVRFFGSQRRVQRADGRELS